MAAQGIALELGRRRGRRRLESLRRIAKRKYLATASAVVLMGLVFTAIFAPLLAPYDPLEVNVSERLEAPQLSHPMGTDEVGRDIMSRIIYGARVSLMVGIASVSVGTFIGITLGLTSAYFRGRYDLIVQRFIDAWQAFPGLILAMSLVALLGQSLLNVIIAISITGISSKTRLVRGSAMSVLQNDYIAATRVVGSSATRIMFRHVLPNIWAPIIVVISLTIGGAILAEASLSFLGLGPPPPDPTWGNMISGSARQLFDRAPWMLIAPGLAITVVIMAFNLMGDGLRDILDPRLRGSE